RNQWVHVAVTLSGNTARMYINGVEKASNANITANPSQIAGANNWLGKSQYAWDPYFNGSMNDVRVFNRALSSAEIHSLWQGTRAVLVLPFDESSAVNGAALQDASGWEYYATLQSGANDTAEKAVWGNIGSHALYFDGVDDRVVVPHAAQLSLDRFTISLWVNPTSAQPNWHALLSKSDSYGRGRNYALFLMPGSTRVHAYVHKADCASYTRLDSGIDLPLNTWSHVSLTYDGAFLRLYINGKLDQSAASTGGLCQTNNDIWIGKVANAYDAFHGALDDIRIYPRALNTAEIADLGNAHWRHTNVSGSLWALNVPAGLEGVYRIETRAADSAGHTSFNTHAPINQTIDSLPPRLSLTREVLNTTGSWNNKKYKYVFRAEDLYLDDKGLVTPCGTNGEVQKEYRKDADSGASVLVGITVTCTLPQPASSETASVRDVAGNTSSCSAPGVCTQPLASLSMPVVSTALPGIASDAKSTVLPSMNAEGMQDTGMANVLPDSIALARFDASTPFTSAWNASTYQSENTPEDTFWGYLALQVLKPAPKDGVDESTPESPSGDNVSTVTIVCRGDSSDSTMCADLLPSNGFAQGAGIFETSGAEPMGAGASSAIAPSDVFTITGTAGPETILLSAPPNPAASSDAAFTFTSDDPAATFECQLDGGGFAACVSPQTYAALLDGLHTFNVRAIDLVGNPDPTPVVYTWTVDTIAPDTTLLSTPTDPTASTAVTFTFNSDDPAAMFECQLDGGSFAPCDSPQTYTGLLDGLHTFDVRAMDLAGNVDPTPAVYTWTVDSLVPDTILLSTPPDPTASTTVTFTFGSDDPAATFECQLDGGGFAACVSPQAYAGLLDGLHTFEVRAMDLAGNLDPTPAVYTWTVDTIAPDTALLSTPPNPSTSITVTFAFTSSDPTASFECQLDGGGFAACASPQAYAGLLDGLHTFDVRAVDLAGNVDP
ncbi:MAG: LamG domain-containing protein, partial [Anaerolineae bacterium]